MRASLGFFFFVVGYIVLFASCRKDIDLSKDKYKATPYILKIPSGFPPPVIEQGVLTEEGVKLGRMLYYDDILSSNGLSCSSCHSRAKSFSTEYHIHPNGEKTSVPVHVNLAWKNKFLWSGGMSSIQEVCMEDFGPEFFNTNMNDLVTRLKNHDQYPIFFYQTFGIHDLSALSHEELKGKIVTAIAQFMNTLISSNSRYDMFRRQEINLTQEELRGYIIFNSEEGDCFHCHGSVLYTDNRLHNNGLDENPTGQNMGYYNFSKDSSDIGKFLAPTLRNIELSAPYMHDGRYNTLEEVVEFYDNGVHINAANIDPIMTKPFKLSGLHLTPLDKQCLVKFLKTFTDTTFINNPDYKRPF